MADATADTSDIHEAFDVPGIVRGLNKDLQDLRAGLITPKEAQVRADVAKQIFNGLRMLVQAQRYFSDRAKPVAAISEAREDEQ